MGGSPTGSVGHLTLLALKLLLAPALIVAASLVGRRFGVRVGGVVAGLPAIGGPILLVLAVDHGAAFARTAALGTLLGIVALMAFVTAYTLAAQRLSWPWAVAAGWTAFAVGILALRPVHLAPLPSLVAACAATAATLLVLPRPRGAVPDLPHPRLDLPLRALAGIVPVVAITAAAHLLGAHLSGLLASFPIITPVLAAFTHAQRGGAEAARLLRGMAVGFVAYGLFCFTVAVAIRPLGTGACFALATAVACVAQLAATLLTPRDEPVPVEAPV